MNRFQEMVSYYCAQLHSEWAQKKALAYLRILAEAEGIEQGEEKEGNERDQAIGMREQGLGESTEFTVQSTDIINDRPMTES